jgi:hypothetical protein
MESQVEEYNFAIKAEQERQALAARADYLQSLMEGNVEERERRLAPHTFKWGVKPWNPSSSIPNQDYNWIGTRMGDGRLANEVGAELLQEPYWAALRHGEVREFPLEQEPVSDAVFDGIYNAMVADDIRSLPPQWASKVVRGGTEIVSKMIRMICRSTCPISHSFPRKPRSQRR